MNQNKKIETQLKKLLNTDCDQNEKLIRLLQVGSEYFGLMLGLISEIKNQNYHVVAAYPDGLLNAGEVFDLSDTICDVTHNNQRVTCFAKASGTDWVQHPAYDKFSIEAYIGVSYKIGHNIVGTINFSSPTALGHTFTNKDEALMKTFAKTLTKIRAQ